MQTVKLALIGRKIGHSKSPELYRKLLPDYQVDYTLLDLPAVTPETDLQQLITPFQGVSITAPYKESFLDQVTFDPLAQSLGSINCLKQQDRSILATNTDALAIDTLIDRYTKVQQIDSLIILGSGAMAKIVSTLLHKKGYQFTLFSRKTHGALEKLDLSNYGAKPFIINCCSRDFIYQGQLSQKTLFWDLNYNFSPHHHFNQMVTYIDGLELLKLQAKHALNFWQIE